MKPTRAEFVLSTGYTALFAVRVVPEDVEHDGPFLLLPVTDYDDAADVLDTLERSAARKRAEKPKQPAAAGAVPPPGPAARGQGGPPPVKCSAPGCTFDADTFAATDNEVCRDHASASPAEKDAWRTAQENAKKPTPATQGGKRARKIIDQIEHLQGIDNASTRTTALPNGPGPKAA